MLAEAARFGMKASLGTLPNMHGSRYYLWVDSRNMAGKTKIPFSEMGHRINLWLGRGECF
jgi:hypothetical protein